MLYRDKLRSVLGGSTTPASATKARESTEEGGSGSSSPVDEEHLLPLVHSHPGTPITPFASMGGLQVPKRSDSGVSEASSATFGGARSGASSTVGDGDEEGDVYASPYEDEELDVEPREGREGKKGKWYSWRWRDAHTGRDSERGSFEEEGLLGEKF